MNLDDLQTFLRVAEFGSFTKAAATLAVPKSTVSRRVARLEEALGTQLLHRTTRKLVVTDVGRTVVERSARAIHDLENMERLLEDREQHVRGVLRLTAPTDLPMGAIVASFRRQEPEVEVEIIITKRVVDLVEEGIDAAVRATAGQLPDETALMARKLATVKMILIASPDYLKRYPAPKTGAELGAHDLVTFPQRATTWTLRPPASVDAARTPTAVPVHGKTSSTDFMLVRDLVVAGAGIGYVPSHLARESLSSGRLVEVLPGWSTAQGAIWLVWPRARYLSPRVRAFVDHVVETTRTNSRWNG